MWKWIKMPSFMKRKRLDLFSIKESLDLLPDGLCVYDADGMVRLANKKMNALCFEMTGEELQNGETFLKRFFASEAFSSALEEGDAKRIYQGADGKTYHFTVTKLMRPGTDAMYQLTAKDITEKYTMLLELEEKNRELRETERKLKLFSANVEELAVEKERLDAKVRIHDNIGQALLQTRRILQNPPEDAEEELEQLRKRWENNLKILRGETLPKNSNLSISALTNIAETVGLRIEFSGTAFPQNALSEFLFKATAEVMINAVKHANAKTIYISRKEEAGFTELQFRNDGRAPEGKIQEGGGLREIRRRIQELGGIMSLRESPEYRLILSMPSSKEIVEEER